MPKNKTYIHLLDGNQVTAEEYKKMEPEEQAYYDRISSVKKAKAELLWEEEE